MRVRRTRALATALGAVFALSACAPAEDVGADPDDPHQVEIITSWTTGAEQTGLYDLIAEFEAQHSGIRVIDASVRGEADAREAIEARLAAGNPPDVILTSPGAALHDESATGRLQELGASPAATAWIEDCRPELVALLNPDGRVLAVPAGVRRGAMLWAGTGVLERAGVDPAIPPASLDDWIADLERVRASGVEFPLALGEPSTRVELFEAILLADLGAVGYQALWTNAATWEPRRLRVAIAHYARVLEFADPAAGSVGWIDAVKRVASGRAGYVVASDAASAVFHGAGFEQGDQFTAAPLPGTEGVFVVRADAFSVPVGAAHDASARAWLATASSPEGQAALGAVTGSIPTAASTDPSGFAAPQRTSLAALARDVLVPSVASGLAASPSWSAAIADAVAAFGIDRRPEALVSALVAAADAELG